MGGSNLNKFVSLAKIKNKS